MVGIGGSGMGGIAEVLLNLGYTVTGSDVSSNSVTQRLRALGAHIWEGHDAAQIHGADVLVVSSAITEDNPERCAALAQRIPVVRRAEMLAELMRFRYGIAVAGTHGKTTTTSLLVSLLAEGGLDPTFVIGGRLKSTDSHSRLGQSAYLVAEADESDASFLHLQPMMAIVTNVDADHLSTYGGDFAQLQATFLEFLQHLPFYGLAVLCAHDPHLRALTPKLGRPVITYGIDIEADVQALEVLADGTRTHFKVKRPQCAQLLPMTLNLPGRHNVLNALAAIAIATELGIEDAAIQCALAQFQGIERRFQIHGELDTVAGKVIWVDDYGHHPTEIAATLQAARTAWPERRVVLAFQPHRYSRTRDLFDEFARVLALPEVLVLMDIYAAGEAALPGIDGQTLAKAVAQRAAQPPVFVANPQALAQQLKSILRDGDVLLTQGAGNVGSLATHLPRELAR